MSRRNVYVVVSGPPASGKSTLAPALAEALELPLIAKDTIKDALMEQLGAPSIEASRALGRAAVRVLLAVACQSPGAVLESVWHRSVAARELAALPLPVVEVFCRCDRGDRPRAIPGAINDACCWSLRSPPDARGALERRDIRARGWRLAGDRGGYRG